MLTLKVFVNDSIIVKLLSTPKRLSIAISLLLAILFDRSYGYALLEGSNCKLNNDNVGVCVKITECTSVLNALKSGKISFDDLIQCSFVGAIQVICCGDRTPTYIPQNVATSTQIPDQIIFLNDMHLTTIKNNVVVSTTSKPIAFDDYDKNVLDAIFNTNSKNVNPKNSLNNKNNNLPSVTITPTVTEPPRKNQQGTRHFPPDSNSINGVPNTVETATDTALIGPDKWMLDALEKAEKIKINEQKENNSNNFDREYSQPSETPQPLSSTRPSTFNDPWILIALKPKGNNEKEISINAVQNNNNNWNLNQEQHQQSISSKLNFNNNPFFAKITSTSQSPLLVTNIQLPSLDPWMIDALKPIFTTTIATASIHGNTHHTHESMKHPIWSFSSDKDNEINVSKATTIERIQDVTPVSRIGRKADIACEQYSSLSGPSLTYHILDGVPVAPGEFPHMAALGYPVIETSTVDVEWDCGGSLISERFVLTAAHCASERRRPVVIRLGAIDLSSTEFVDSGISEIIPHPSYKPNEQYNDIALIRLDKVMEFNFYIRPACLNTNISEVSQNERLIATGWGVVSLKNKRKSRVLLQANLTSVSLSACNESFVNYYLDRRIRHGIVPAQLCAHDPESRRDTCEGDSGGPLQIKTSKESYIIVGVTSFGISCGSSIPGVYAKVSNYLEWIESVVW